MQITSKADEFRTENCNFCVLIIKVQADHDKVEADLIALANGATLRYPLTTNGHASGYSELAAQLHKNRAVIRDLLTPA